MIDDRRTHVGNVYKSQYPENVTGRGLSLLVGVEVVTFIFDVAEFFCNTVQRF